MDRFIESVESRRHFSVVTVTGTSGADTIYVDIVGANVEVTLNGVTTPYTSVTGISISAGTGADLVEFIGGDFTRPATISGNSGNDTIFSGAGADNITGNDGNDLIYGNDGNDTINGNDGNDTVYGGNGNDGVYGGNNTDYLLGGDGNDTIGGPADGVLDYLYGNDLAGTSDGDPETFQGDAGDLFDNG